MVIVLPFNPQTDLPRAVSLPAAAVLDHPLLSRETIILPLHVVIFPEPSVRLLLVATSSAHLMLFPEIVVATARYVGEHLRAQEVGGGKGGYPLLDERALRIRATDNAAMSAHFQRWIRR